MKILDLLRFSESLLGKELHLDAEILLAHAINKDRAWMLAHSDLEMSETQVAMFRSMIERRASGEPVAYITGTKEFFGLDFKVNNHVLVPRPETELLVEMGLEGLDKNPDATVIDVGTGSGAIAVAVAKNAPHARIVATDVSRDALAVAKENAQRHNVLHQIELEHGNLLEPIDFKAGRYIILANLPYLSEEEYNQEPSIRAEPKTALVADDNGNAFYRELFEQLEKLPEGVLWTLFPEFDPRHAAWMMQAAQENFSNKKIETQKDLAGLERVLSIRPV